MARRLLLIIFCLTVGISTQTFGQSLPGASSALKIRSEQEGLFILELPRKKTRLSSFVVFVRPNGSDFEIIARGKIEVIQSDKILASIDRQGIIKYPIPGDLAVPMSPPRDWPSGLDPSVPEPVAQGEPLEEPGDPGYLEFAYGLLNGDLSTTSSDQRSNEYKDIGSYRPTYFRGLWYFDFLWRLGIEYESSTGSFPTSTYYRSSGNSKESVDTFYLNYRFRKTWFKKRLRPIIRVSASNSSFTTLNPDEALISTSTSGIGAGFRMSYETDSLLWKPRSRSGFKIIQAYADLNLYPLLDVADGGAIKRGTSSSGSFEYNWKIGVSALTYVHWIPWFKRYTLDIGYAQRTRSLKFSGATQSEADGQFYQIPEGTTSTETTKFFFVTLGLRIEDFIGAFLKPR